MELTISEVARRLELSERTVRRRLLSGELGGRHLSTPQGFTWMIDLPDDPSPKGTGHGNGDGTAGELEAVKDTVRRQDEAMEQLRNQLEAKDRQIEQLHVLLQQQALALPAPKENRQSWWRFWRG